MALNYRKTLLVIRDRLESKEGRDPISSWNLGGCREIDQMIALFDHSPAARQLLEELGGEWPLTKEEA